MSNSNNNPSGSPSLPIPISTRSTRNIEDILNLSTLGSPSSTTPTSPRHRYGSAAAPPASPRPSSIRHALSSSASTSASPAPRHGLQGGTGAPAWGPRSLTSATAPPPALHTPSARAPRPVSTFEPRVIRGTLDRGGDAAAPPLSPAGQLALRRNSTSMATTRPRRPSVSTTASIGVARSPALRPPLSGTASTGPVAPAGSTAVPAPFPRPSYLQYSALRDLLQTDTSPSLPPSRYNTDGSPPRLTGVPSYMLRREDTPLMTDSDDDSESSVSRPFSARGRDRERSELAQLAPAPFISARPILRLPTRWSQQDRHSAITVSGDGRELHFHGPTSTGDKEAAAARTNYSIPPACGVFYYEVEILNKGQKGHISIGFSVAEVRLTRLPGWEKNSWGYHGDDGNSFASEKNGTTYGPKFSTGDVIGCGIDFSQHKAFYTKNGHFLGTVFEGVGQDSPVFPSIGLRSAGEAVRANFGHEQFKYGIEFHVHEAREKMWSEIQRTPVKWTVDDANNNVLTVEADRADSYINDTSGSRPADSVVKAEVDQGSSSASLKLAKRGGEDDFVPIKLPQDFQSPINKLVLSYLTHHGYEGTARSLQAQIDAKRGEAAGLRTVGRAGPYARGAGDPDIKMETDDTTSGACHLDFDGMEPETGAEVDRYSRQRIVNAVLAGDIDRVLDEMREWHPAVLEREDGLILFKLRCRKFVELLLKDSEALKRSKAAAAASEGEVETDMDRLGAMDVDGDSAHAPATNGFSRASKHSKYRTSRKRIPSHAEEVGASVPNEAVDYGRGLLADYKEDSRPEVQNLFQRTFSLVAYDDPSEAPVDIAELVTHEARVKLAQDVNQAILESQGRPSRPALERMYRQAAAVLMQLALMGNGAAAFADMSKEFLEQ